MVVVVVVAVLWPQSPCEQALEELTPWSTLPASTYSQARTAKATQSIWAVHGETHSLNTLPPSHRRHHSCLPPTPCCYPLPLPFGCIGGHCEGRLTCRDSSSQWNPLNNFFLSHGVYSRNGNVVVNSVSGVAARLLVAKCN